jgi:hypothetical protein
MKLHSPQFEKSLRRGVKQTIRKSPRLKQEYRAARKFRRHCQGTVLFRPLASVALAFVVRQVAIATGHPASALAIISLWLFLILSMHANRLRLFLFASRDLLALSPLPVDKAAIFRWELQKYLRTALWLLLDLAAALGVLAYYLDFSVLRWGLAAGIGILAWMTNLSLVMLCVARLPWKKYTHVPGVFFMIGAILVLDGKLFGWAGLLRVLDRIAPDLNSLLPTGWAISQSQLLLPQPSWITAALLIPIAVVIGTLPNSLARLRNFYAFSELTRPEAPDLLSNPAVLPRRRGNSRPAVVTPRVGPSAIAEMIQLRQFLAGAQWSQRGWFEMLLWKWLTPREQVLSDFVFPGGVAISAAWIKILQTLAVAAAGGFVVGMASPLMTVWVLGAGIFITFIMVTTQIYQSGRSFHVMLSGGLRMPLHTNFALGLPELARLLFKYTAVQLPMLLAWSIVCGMLIMYLNQWPLAQGVLYGLRGGCLLFAGRIFLVVFGFSSCTSSTGRRFGVRNLISIPPLMVVVFLFVGLGGFALLAPSPGLAWLLTLSAMLDACLFFFIYAWFYGRNFFDLISLPRR